MVRVLVTMLLCGLLLPGVAGARVTPAMDPTRPPATVLGEAGKAATVWQLGSVLVSDARRVAVVNGRVVAEGDEVLGARVARIREDGVLLRPTGGEPVLLTLDTVKVRSGATRVARAAAASRAAGQSARGG